MKTVLVTGANRGIGQALVNTFLANGYNVMGTCRQPIAAEQNESKIKYLNLNITDNSSIETFCKTLSQQNITIDILINNAAIGTDLESDLPEHESFINTFNTNVTGTVFFTEAILPYLNSGAKIIMVSSKMGSIATCVSTNAVAYRMSKTALNMYTKILANRLANTHLVAAIHPGWVQTDISTGNSNAPLTPNDSALKIYDFVTSNFRHGIYFNVADNTELPW